MTPHLDRRGFVVLSSSLLGGLMLRLDESPESGVWQTSLSPILRIEPDGTVILAVPIPEIGQGIRTASAMLVAEELDVRWDAIRLEQADAIETDQRAIAAGSHSVRDSWEPLRRLGATARDQLVRAAAARWGVEPSSCETNEGIVRHAGSGRRLAYGAVAAEAARLTVRTDVPLRPRGAHRVVGRPTRGLDVDDIVTGRRVFGIDVRRPGMRVAVVARAPVVGGRVATLDDRNARATPGVVDVVRVAPYGDGAAPTVPAGVAVIATNTWAAMEGRRALRLTWDHGAHRAESTANYERLAVGHLDARDDTMYREHGDAALRTPGDRLIRARYHLPFLPHATMEPPDCTVEIRGEHCEIWAPTQIPMPTRNAVARFLGWPAERVTLHVTAMGGGFGRRLDADYVLEAVAVARQVSGPVMVLWTREDDLQHGFFRPYAWHEIEATVRPDGSLQTWQHRQAGTSRYAGRAGRHPGSSEFLSGTWPAAFAGAHRLGYALVESPFDRGPLRAPGNNGYVFAVESFLDEIAAATQQDPLAFRLRLLAGDRRLPAEEGDPEFETARMRAVLETAARSAEWSRPRPPGTGLGLAAAYVFGSYVAHVVEVRVDTRDAIAHCERVWSAIDCGQVINPLGVRAQMEGGFLDGLSVAKYGEITVVDGEIQERNFQQYRLLRMPEVPDIHVEIIASDAPPMGAGEPPYPPALPAFTNAIARATGARLRVLPARSERLRAALETSRRDA